MRSAIKKNPLIILFIIVSVAVLGVIVFGFAISFESLKLVGKDLAISIPLYYPLLFELSAIAAGIVKAYLEIAGIDDKGTERLANIMLWSGVLLSVFFNVYHVLPLMVGADWWVIVALTIAHSFPSILVVGGMEIVIALGRHTFANTQTTDILQKKIDKLLLQLNKTNRNLETLNDQNTTLIDQNKEKDLRLSRYTEMPPILELLLAVYNEESEITELDKLFKFSKNRFTSFHTFMEQEPIIQEQL